MIKIGFCGNEENELKSSTEIKQHHCGHVSFIYHHCGCIYL